MVLQGNNISETINRHFIALNQIFIPFHICGICVKNNLNQLVSDNNQLECHLLSFLIKAIDNNSGLKYKNNNKLWTVYPIPNTLTIDDFQGLSTKKQISKPPLNLLFNPSLIDKQDVWQINVVKLLEMLLAVLKSSGNNDLRICGVAILTSALIHRLKVESIFKLDKIANQKEIKDDKGKNVENKTPIPELESISLPFRKETSYPASLEELLLILENMITELSNPTVRKNQIDLEPVQTFDFQEYLIKFEKVIEEYENKLFDKLIADREIFFNNFVKEMSDLEIARYFIAMLYLAMKRKIEIVYEKPNGSHSIGYAEGPVSVSVDGIDFRNNENLDSIKITAISD